MYIFIKIYLLQCLSAKIDKATGHKIKINRGTVTTKIIIKTNILYKY